MKLIDTNQVLAIVGMCRTSLYYLIRDDKFPQPVIGGRKRRWRDSDVVAWIESL